MWPVMDTLERLNLSITIYVVDVTTKTNIVDMDHLAYEINLE